MGWKNITALILNENGNASEGDTNDRIRAGGVLKWICDLMRCDPVEECHERTTVITNTEIIAKIAVVVDYDKL
jgi:hypothetical protein